MTTNGTSRLVISHVVDHYRRYPGEKVTFFTRVTAREAFDGFTLRVVLPAGLALGDQRSSLRSDFFPEVLGIEDEIHLIWTIRGRVQPGSMFEFEADAVVSSSRTELVLESRASVTVAAESQRSGEESVELRVLPKGNYLKYLPGIYERDELMGRFLMLFESFWAPIEGQIDNISLYFDPKLAPAELLPWLASWLNLAFDERWPEDRRRRLLASAASLFRSRGTRAGLQQYLEIYTGRPVQIIEHRANNLRLGSAARLGPGIALGKGNVPHTFTVTVQLPEIIRAASEEERYWQENEQRRVIESIIDAEKPAHTSYTLYIETIPAEERPLLLAPAD